jgi:hypothetical protein
LREGSSPEGPRPGIPTLSASTAGRAVTLLEPGLLGWLAVADTVVFGLRPLFFPHRGRFTFAGNFSHISFLSAAGRGRKRGFGTERASWDSRPVRGGAAAARQAHNLKVAGSSPVPASKLKTAPAPHARRARRTISIPPCTVDHRTWPVISEPVRSAATCIDQASSRRMTRQHRIPPIRRLRSASALPSEIGYRFLKRDDARQQVTARKLVRRAGLAAAGLRQARRAAALAGGGLAPIGEGTHHA